jgi:hypothetical protein
VAQFSTNEDAVDAAVPVDAQNAPTGTWKLQNSFHSANSAHLLFEKASTQTEESRRVNPVSGFHTPASARSDGSIDPIEQRRHELYARLRALGAGVLPALARGLANADVQIPKVVANFADDSL